MNRSKRIMMIFCLLWACFTGTVFAGSMDNPLQQMIADPRGPVAVRNCGYQWSLPILVYSDSLRNIYVDEDFVNIIPIPRGYAMPLPSAGWINLYAYVQEGKFQVKLITEYKKGNPALKKHSEGIAEGIKKTGHPEDFKHLHPELFKYITEIVVFDMKTNTATSTMVCYLDRDGDILVEPNSKTVDYDFKSSIGKKLVQRIVSVFESARKDPKMVDTLAEMKKNQQSRRSSADFSSIMQEPVPPSHEGREGTAPNSANSTGNPQMFIFPQVR